LCDHECVKMMVVIIIICDGHKWCDILKMMKKCFSNTESFSQKAQLVLDCCLGGYSGRKVKWTTLRMLKISYVFYPKWTPDMLGLQICWEAKFQPFRMDQENEISIWPSSHCSKELDIARTWGAIPEMQDLFDIYHNRVEHKHMHCTCTQFSFNSKTNWRF